MNKLSQTYKHKFIFYYSLPTSNCSALSCPCSRLAGLISIVRALWG